MSTRTHRRPLHRVVFIVVAALVVGLCFVGTNQSAVRAESGGAPGMPAAMRRLAAGSGFTCAVVSTGAVKCWGFGGLGRLGTGNTSTIGDQAGEMGNQLKSVDLGTSRSAREIAAGGNSACALLDGGDVKCWGSGNFGQLGLGDSAARGDGPNEMGDNLPAVQLGTGRRALSIAVGGDFSCAILDDGTVKCWGRNDVGQLGQGDTANRGDNGGEMNTLLPVQLGTGRTAVSIAAEATRVCVILDNGSVKCWGGNSFGELGLGDVSPRGDAPNEMGDNLPAVQLGSGRTATALSLGLAQTCALLDNRSVKCWGEGAAGGLGNGDSNDHGSAPGQMGDNLPAVQFPAGRHAVALSSANASTCAVLDNARLACWGSGSSGQLGSGNTSSRGGGPLDMGANLPVLDLGTISTVSAIVSSAESTCALTSDSHLKCWGSNASGELGLGDTLNRGDNAGEMGDALPAVDLGGSLIPARSLSVSVSGGPSKTVTGGSIVYSVTVTNTGTTAVTAVNAVSTSAPLCGRNVAAVMLPGASVTYTCGRVADTSDIPMIVTQVFVSADDGVSALSLPSRTLVDKLVVRPDGSIRKGGDPFVGGNVYNTTGKGQTRKAPLKSKASATFTVRIQNDGNAKEAYTLRGTAGTSKFGVTYKRLGTVITASVTAGTFTTPGIDPGTSIDITVVVTATKKATLTSALAVSLTLTGTTVQSKQDTVRIKATRI